MRDTAPCPHPAFLSSAFMAELYLCLLEIPEVSCRIVACPGSCPPGLSGHHLVPEPHVGHMAQAGEDRMRLRPAPPWGDRGLGPG